MTIPTSSTDPLAALRQSLAAKAATAQPVPKPSAQPQGTGAGTTGAAKPATAAPQTGSSSSSTVETLFQRARYFENLVEHLFSHVKDLSARLTRTGTAAPVVPHFPALKSAAGDFDPNS